MSTHNVPFSIQKKKKEKKIIQNYPKSAAMGFFPMDYRTSSEQSW